MCGIDCEVVDENRFCMGVASSSISISKHSVPCSSFAVGRKPGKGGCGVFIDLDGVELYQLWGKGIAKMR